MSQILDGKNLGLILIAVAVLIMVAAQLTLKSRFNVHGVIPLSINEFFKYLLIIIRDPMMWLAGIGLVASAILWYAAVSRVPLSVAFPLAASSYPLIFVASILFLGESFSFEKLFANLLIITGVVWLGLKVT